MTKDELITKLQEESKDLSSYLSSDDYSNAADRASYDTGWAYPVSTSFRITWQLQRSFRWLYFYLLNNYATKFKFEQINLQQRWEHFRQMIKDIDEQFEKAVQENPAEFADVDTYKMFGTKIDAGFAYENGTGRDITYDEDQEVIVKP